MKAFIALFALLCCSAASGQRHQLALPSDAGPAACGEVQFIGTATVLLRCGGLTVMTDPNFLHKGDHVHLGYGLKAQRLTDPAIPFEQLPHIDLVLLSHLHEDHFDKLVQEKLDKDTPIVSNAAAVAGLRALGFRKVYELATWEAMEVSKGAVKLRLTAMPGRHGPAGVAALLPPVMGTMLDFSSGGASYRIYVSGDTMVYGDIEEIPRRFPGIDLALLHLGGTRILSVVTVTMDAKDGVRMLKLVAPSHAIPIHYNDYDRFKSPLSAFQREVEAAGLANIVTYLKHGETYRFKPVRR